jgi:hypothetical protein
MKEIDVILEESKKLPPESELVVASAINALKNKLVLLQASVCDYSDTMFGLIEKGSLGEGEASMCIGLLLAGHDLGTPSDKVAEDCSEMLRSRRDADLMLIRTVALLYGMIATGDDPVSE